MDRETVFSDRPAEMALRWEGAGAQRLHLVDLDGALSGRPVNAPAVESILEAVKIPVQLGGGIRDRRAMMRYQELGVSRIILGTAATLHPEALRRLVEDFPGEVAVGIDARDGLVAVRGWTETVKKRATELAQDLAGLPLAAVIYTDIARDGMMEGPNLEAIEKMLPVSPAPLIASGGVSTTNDVRRLVEMGKEGLAGVIIGRALYDGRIDLARALQLAEG